MVNTFDSQVVDKNKLTIRELLILLSDQMETVKKDVSKLKEEQPIIRERVTKIETRMIVIASSFGLVTIVITLVINFIRIFI